MGRAKGVQEWRNRQTFDGDAYTKLLLWKLIRNCCHGAFVSRRWRSTHELSSCTRWMTQGVWALMDALHVLDDLLKMNETDLPRRA